MQTTRYAGCLMLMLLWTLGGPGAATWAQPAPAETTATKLERAAELARTDMNKALPLCEEVFDAKDATAAQRAQAALLAAELRLRQRKFDDALKLAQRLEPLTDPAAQAAATFIRADVLRAQKKLPDATAKLGELSSRQPENAEARAKYADFLLETGKTNEAWTEAERALNLTGLNPAQRQRTMWVRMEASWRGRWFDKCLTALEALLDPKSAQTRDPGVNRELRSRMLQCLTELKRPADAAAKAAEFAGNESDAAWKQRWTLTQGEQWIAAGRDTEALSALERVITQGGNPDLWWTAQRRMVETLLRQGDFAAALPAAHILYDGAGDANAVADACRLTAEAFKGVDKNLARANAFIQYQRFGPGGKDDKSGLSAPLKNPLDEVGYPAYAERKKALAELRQTAGDGALSSRLRAMTYIYTGQPKEALRDFLDAFARAGTNDLQGRADDLILLGVRAVRGHALGLETYYQFINHGPAGPDGQAGTADDLADPFAQLLK